MMEKNTVSLKVKASPNNLNVDLDAKTQEVKQNDKAIFHYFKNLEKNQGQSPKLEKIV
jgi:hypothetical protein